MGIVRVERILPPQISPKRTAQGLARLVRRCGEFIAKREDRLLIVVWKGAKRFDKFREPLGATRGVRDQEVADRALIAGGS